MSRAGYVLVGGRSSRMGRDKALLPFRGGPLAESVARAVETAAGSATLVGNPHLYRQLGFPAIADAYPGQGPLAGILAALEHTSAQWNLLTACDMPGLSVEFLRRLLDAAEDSGSDALTPTGPSGRPEPLCAVYHRRILPVLDAAFARGVRQVTAALRETRLVLLPIMEVTPFQNVNTPVEWAQHVS